MKILKRRIIALVIPFFFIGLAGFNFKQKQAPKPPNIILIMVDDMGYSDIGCYGGEIETPTIDRLANEGIRFTHFYNTAKCFSTRASLLTGLYAYQAHAGQGWSEPMRDCMMIPEVLKTAGYKTMFSGKWHLHDKPFERGFEKNYGFTTVGIINSYFHPYVEGPPRPWGDQSNFPVSKWVLDDHEIDKYKPNNPDWYATDAFTAKVMNWIDENQNSGEPFFAYLAYNAPHWPLQAPDSIISKYVGKYRKGWDKIREERHGRMIELGIIDESWPLSPRDEDVPGWEDVPDKAVQDSLMAVYAAMIDRVDWNIGRLVEKLKDIGEYDNTLIMFLSDNGGDAMNFNGNPEQPIGSPLSYNAYGRAWANVSNTPFRRFKGEAHEGGIATPLVIHWPAGIEDPGRISKDPGHLADIMATCVEASGATYPSLYNGEKIVPMQGKSLVPDMKVLESDPHTYVFFSRPGGQAIRKGKWKLVRLRGQEWELYDMNKDRIELNNLADEYPEKVNELLADYKSWGAYSQVTDWESWILDRSSSGRIKALDIKLLSQADGKWQLKLKNRMSHQMAFKGDFATEGGNSVNPKFINESLEPGEEKLIAITINKQSKSKQNDEVILEWSNQYINEYEFDQREISIETGHLKIK
jgi:arylsulfatase A-like enzyme